MKPFLEPILHYLRVKEIIKKIPRGSKVCDVCCGEKGSFLFDISDILEEGIGLDKDAENKREGKILLKKSDLEKEISEKSNYFDCVILLAAIEHLNYPQEIIKECFRILKEGGKALITTPSAKGRWLLEFLSFRLGIVSPEQIKDHKHYFNKKEIFDLFVEAGFDRQKISLKEFEFGYNIFAEAIK